MVKGQKDYDNAKVYKLICDIDDNFYIGSTCTSLTVRLAEHKRMSRSKPDRKVYKWINDVGVDNIRIILINDDFVCNNMDQLRREEDTYIQMYKKDENCMNSIRSYLTIEERKEQVRQYLIDNKESIAEKKRQRYEDNKEQILERNRQKITCSICECEITRSGISQHNKTIKHVANTI